MKRSFKTRLKARKDSCIQTYWSAVLPKTTMSNFRSLLSLLMTLQAMREVTHVAKSSSNWYGFLKVDINTYEKTLLKRY